MLSAVIPIDAICVLGSLLIIIMSLFHQKMFILFLTLEISFHKPSFLSFSENFVQIFCEFYFPLVVKTDSWPRQLF